MTDNTFAAWVARYKHNPVLFVQEVLGADPDNWQKVALNAYRDGVRHIAIKSAHGPGKTVVESWCAIHQILCWYPQKCVATAPTSAQLFDALAAEMKAWIRRLPEAVQALLEVKSDRIELKADPNGSFISFRTSRAENPEAMQGVHSDKVLLLADEASAIPEPVFEAAVGSMSGKHATTILASNPTRSSGTFHDAFHKNADQWLRIHVCADVPEASPGAYTSPRITPEFVEYVADQYGRDSNAFLVRVLGEFPRSDIDTLIPFELVDGARRRNVVMVPNAKVVWGLDVGGRTDSGDRSALCRRQGNIVLGPVETRQGLETMQVAGWIHNTYEQTHPANRPIEILVDAIGIGAGVASRLREIGLPAQAVNVSESPSSKEQFSNLRAELWWKAKEWFQARDCQFPDDEPTIAELLAVKADYNSSNKLVIESKKKMRKERRGSPDRADAFVLTFAGASGLFSSGWSPSSPWNQPIKRNMGGIV